MATQQHERVGAQLIHYHIALWFASCSGLSAIEDLPNSIAVQISPLGVTSWAGWGEKLPKPPTVQQRRIMELSDLLYRERIEQEANVRSSYFWATGAQLLIILLGFATTAVVAFSSSQYGRGASRSAALLRAFAIMLPMASTAAASVNAYFGWAQQVAQSRNTLASLSQLHSQVALEIWPTGCDAAKIDKLTTQWVKRYQEIQTLAATAPETKSAEGLGKTK